MKKILFVLSWHVCACLYAGDYLTVLRENYGKEAAAAESEGRLLQARNAWYKYVHLAGPERSPGIDRAQRRLGELEETLWPPPAHILPVPKPESAPVISSRPPPRARLSGEELIKKAETLRQNGQLDEALRFYRLAEEAAPESAEEVRKKIEALQKEMN